MKRHHTVRAAAFLLAVILTAAGCRPIGKQSLRLFDYTLLPVEAGLPDDGTAPLPEAERLMRIEERSESDGAEKRIALFREDYTVVHTGTRACGLWSDERMVWQDGESGLRIETETRTGRMRRFDVGGERGIQPVPPEEFEDVTGEEAFTEYAQRCLSTFCSTEGCEREISTRYRYGNDVFFTADSFVGPEAGAETDFYAIYTFTFYRTLSGIRRADPVSVELDTRGEILSVRIDREEMLFSPFENIAVDREKADALVKEAARRGNAEVRSLEPMLYATADGFLWLLLRAEFKRPDGAEGPDAGIYLIKIAGIVPATPAGTAPS